MSRKQCCCCGGDAGNFQQHSNRDNGYGICAVCISHERRSGMSEADIEDLYGKAGVNWRNTITVGARVYTIAAAFMEDLETDEANRYLQVHPDEAVIACEDNVIYIASVKDMGTSAKAEGA